MRRLALAATMLCSAGTAGAAAGGPDAAAPRGTPGGIPVVVRLAGLSPAPRLDGARAARRRALVSHLRERLAAPWQQIEPLLQAGGAREVRLLWGVGGASLIASPELVLALRAHPVVAAVSLDRRWTIPRPPPAPPSPAPWNLEAVGASLLWGEGLTGTGVVVAVLDTGVDGLHPDLAASWRGGAGGWFDAFGAHAAPVDLHGHGTQVAGLVVGGAGSGAPIGVAPGARWIAGRVFDDAGATSLGAIHAGLQWLLDPDGDPGTDDAPDVVNASWGLADLPGECVTEFDDDIAALRAADVVVVFAAGNDGPAAATSVSPANGAGVLSVGAVDETLALVAASGRGPSACSGGTYPALVAPGAGVLTADLTYGGVVLQSYATVSGTSFSAPHVAGAAALLRQACPAAAAASIEAALVAAATDLGPTGADDGFGAGLADAPAARDWLAASGGCSEADGDGGVPADGGTTPAGADGGAAAPTDGAEAEGGAGHGAVPGAAPAGGCSTARETAGPSSLLLLLPLVARARSRRRASPTMIRMRCPLHRNG
jgi:serine protease AprX